MSDDSLNFNRRDFLKVGAILAGGTLVGCKAKRLICQKTPN